jgi:hypothetical protein
MSELGPVAMHVCQYSRSHWPKIQRSPTWSLAQPSLWHLLPTHRPSLPSARTNSEPVECPISIPSRQAEQPGTVTSGCQARRGAERRRRRQVVKRTHGRCGGTAGMLLSDCSSSSFRVPTNIDVGSSVTGDFKLELWPLEAWVRKVCGGASIELHSAW